MNNIIKRLVPVLLGAGAVAVAVGYFADRIAPEAAWTWALIVAGCGLVALSIVLSVVYRADAKRAAEWQREASDERAQAVSGKAAWASMNLTAFACALAMLGMYLTNNEGLAPLLAAVMFVQLGAYYLLRYYYNRKL